MRIDIACGGTGGHVMPGVATARVLEERGHKVVLWLAGRDVERAAAASWQGRTISVRADGLPARFSLRWLPVAARLLAAFAKCRVRMRRDKPDALLAMGGYASVGPGLAAASLNVPTVLHEGNAVPGKAALLLSRFAQVSAAAFADALPRMRGRKKVVTGFPIKQSLAVPDAERLLPPGRFTVLVMGGSQGAIYLNETASEALCSLHAKGIALQVVHLAGVRDEETARRAYERAGIPNAVYGFLEDMGRAYMSADMAVARAGAATCAELAACGVPAVLVPLPSARDNHQAANAEALRGSGAVEVRAQGDLTVEWLSGFIETCCSDAHKLDTMREGLKKAAVPDAANRLADAVEEVGNS